MEDSNHFSWTRIWYESTEDRQDYRIGSEIIYRGRGASIDIGKPKDNYDKDGKPRCFNCNVYGYITKNYQKPTKEKETRKCYKCNKVGYLAKNCRLGQKMKYQSVQKGTDNKESNKEKGFVRDLE